MRSPFAMPVRRRLTNSCKYAFVRVHGAGAPTAAAFESIPGEVEARVVGPRNGGPPVALVLAMGRGNLERDSEEAAGIEGTPAHRQRTSTEIGAFTRLVDAVGNWPR